MFGIKRIFRFVVLAILVVFLSTNLIAADSVQGVAKADLKDPKNVSANSNTPNKVSEKSATGGSASDTKLKDTPATKDNNKSPSLQSKKDNTKDSLKKDSTKNIVSSDEIKEYNKYKSSLLKNEDVNNEDSTKVSISKDFEDHFYGPDVEPLYGLTNPIFFLSEKTNTANYKDTTELCNYLNTSTKDVNCVIYTVDKLSDMSKYLRRGIHSDSYNLSKVDADFAIVREDILHDMLLKKGVLKDAPYLDTVAYLNGVYLFYFANSDVNAYSVEQLMALKRRTTINIGYFNNNSRSIFTKYVRPLFPNNNIRFVRLSEVSASEQLCYQSNIDMYLYLGTDLSPTLQNAFSSCANAITPLTMTDRSLVRITNKFPTISVANVVKYFDLSSIVNFTNIYVSFEREYRNRLEQSIKKQKAIRLNRQRLLQQAQARNERSRSNNQQVQDVNGQSVRRVLVAPPKKTTSPTVKNSVPQPKILKEVLVKEGDIDNLLGYSGDLDSNFKGVFSSIKGIKSTKNEVDNKYYVSANTKVKTIGIRNILVATRYTKQENVNSVLDVIVKNYFSIRDRFLSPDMAKFSISDILFGTSNDKSLRRHPGLAFYSEKMLSDNSTKTKEQVIALKLLLKNLNPESLPKSYLVPTPTNEQFDVIYSRLRELNRRKQELQAIRVFQRDINSLRNNLQTIKTGKLLSDSTLKSLGLGDVDLISVKDEPSVLLEDDIDIASSDIDLDKRIDDLLKPKPVLDEAKTEQTEDLPNDKNVDKSDSVVEKSNENSSKDKKSSEDVKPASDENKPAEESKEASDK